MFIDSLYEDKRLIKGIYGFTHPEDKSVQRFWDDLSGLESDPIKVQEARMEEMKEFSNHQVYIKKPIKECWDNTGKEPIGTRWVDINKGDKINPEYRSRLVAQELNQSKRDDIFAATPPL